ncbi:MAG: extracellular solute-binding protein [Clostridiales bacterium]|jgi:putative aldouronate transport system substrate-binding protein|nr:extracellular solute-binding protein [Clostridiales bacterium]
MKKYFGIFYLSLILSLMASGCAGSEPGASSQTGSPAQAESQGSQPAEILPCRYVVPGTEPEDSPAVDAAINEKLKADGVNLNFSRIYVPWDVWEQKVNIMLSTGEEFELLHIMEDFVPSSSYVAKGALAPLNDALDQYGAKLKELIPEDIWECTSIGGDIYSIPVYYRDFSKHSYIELPKHLFDKYGLSINPANMDELIESYETIIKGEKDPELRYWPKVNTTTDYKLLRELESSPFVALENMFFVDQQGTVKAWLETPEFIKDCEIHRTMYEKGIIHPDILTYPHEKVSQLNEQGKSFDTDLFALEQIRRVQPGFEMASYLPAPEKPRFFGEWVIMNANAASSTSPHPESGVIFFNWLYSAQENYDLLNYGLRDIHWIDSGNRRFEAILDDAGLSKYSFGDWEMGHKDLVRISVSAPKELEPVVFEMNPDAVISVAVGFKFNSEPVSSEYAACLAEIQSSIYPLKYGVVSLDEGYDRAVAAMKAAGYDKVVAEYKAQFDAWYALKSKS